MKPLDILYVDDDADIRHIVALSLALDPMIRLRMAVSGADALTALAAGPLPDVALVDVVMPDLDGPALLERIRALPGAAAIRVIFITAKGRPAEVARYTRQGVIGVLLKPFDPLLLAGQIRALVEAARTA